VESYVSRLTVNYRDRTELGSSDLEDSNPEGDSYLSELNENKLNVALLSTAGKGLSGFRERHEQ
jgi:hypothetical protein